MRPVLTTKTVVEQQNYNFGFDYLSKEFVRVIIGDTELSYPDDYYVNGTTVTLKVKPNEVKHMIIYRKTSTIPLVKWQDGSVMTAKDMNLQELQALHINEETVLKHEDVRKWHHLVQEGKQRVEDKVKEISDTLDHVLQLAGGDVYTRTETDSKLDTFKKDLEANANKTFIITHPMFGKDIIDSGDCTFIGINGKWIIIDSLYSDQRYVQAIIKRMQELNIDKFDLAILTHYHEDHMGGFPYLLANNKIAKLYIPDATKTEVTGTWGRSLSQLEKDKKKILDANAIVNIPIEIVTPKIIEFNGATIEFYNCADEDYEYYRSVGNNDYNNMSVGVEINYLNRTALIEGDFNYLAMERHALRNPTNVDYLKSNHHGISHVPLSYRKVNPRDIIMTTTQNWAVETLYYQDFQNVFQQMGSNIYLLGDQTEPPTITYKGDGSITYNRGLVRDGTDGQATGVTIYVDKNYTGELKTGDQHSPFSYLSDAIRFINQPKIAGVEVRIKAGDYTSPRDKGGMNQNHSHLTISNVHNSVVFRRDGETGIVNLPPILISNCASLTFKDVEFIGVSAEDNRKIKIYDSRITLENVKADSQKHPSNQTDPWAVVTTYGNSYVELKNINFSQGWGAIDCKGGRVVLTGTENHVKTDHHYILGKGEILVETPFIEGNRINKSNDMSAGEIGQVLFKPVTQANLLPHSLLAGTVIPVKNMQKPQEQSFVQATGKVWVDTVYSIVDPSKTITPDYTGQIGIKGEEVFIGANNKWIKISN